MLRNLLHYFLPNQANNYRAKSLHHKSLIFTIAILFFGSFFVSAFRTNIASVLGDSIDVSAQKLLLLTNQKREENGLPALVLSTELSEAAVRKAENMFSENYWAHNSPSGKTPWSFIRDAGYKYIYAGENLAKGFNSAQDAVDAWMKSPKHRENIMSPNYREVGFAVETGRLNGERTILIVEELGSQIQEPMIAKVPAVSENNSSQAFASKEIRPVKQSFVSVLSVSSSIDRTILIFFIFALFLDMIVIERKKVIRFVGHNVDHIFFLTMILLLVSVISKGVII